MRCAVLLLALCSCVVDVEPESPVDFSAQAPTGTCPFGDEAKFPRCPKRRRPGKCRLWLAPHKGGDAHHNACADREPPNRHPGYDVIVAPATLRVRYFDAIDGAGTLWEVKTGRWSRYWPWLQRLELSRTIDMIRRDIATARACGLGYAVGVADRELVLALRARMGLAGIEIRHLPRCVRR